MATSKGDWTTAIQHALSIRGPSNRYDPQPPIYAFFQFQFIFISTWLYRLLLYLRPVPTIDSPHPIRVVTISDTHDNVWPDVPDGDLLIHAGDLTNRGTVADLQIQLDWLKSLPHKHKVVISGNHDTYLDPRSRKSLLHTETVPDLDWGDIRYLQHREIRLEFPKRGARALHIYGAPQVPRDDAPADWAFTYPKSIDAWRDTVPRKIDILVTHGPPAWHLDLYGLGCPHLLRECWRTRPKVHICGHIHTARGYEGVFWDECQRTFELLCARNKDAAFLNSFFSIFNWIHLVSMVLHGLRGILWSRIWGGKDNASILVNTALAYQSTGRLGNPPQVVSI